MRAAPLAPADLDALAWWLSGILPGRTEVRIAPLEQTAGNSHATYRVDRDPTSSDDAVASSWVLRVAPRDERAGGAFDLSREARILRALDSSSVPHPRAVCSGADPGCPIDRDLLVAEWVPGVTLGGPLPPHLDTADNARALTGAIVDALVDIGQVDCESTALRELGDPTTHLERQFHQGRQMLAGFASRDIDHLLGLIDDLDRHRPTTAHTGLVHGDFNPTNLRAHETSPTIVSVFDWETATVGDVLVDLGYLTARWVTPHEDPLLAAFALGGPFEEGHRRLPSRTHLVERYRDRTGRSLDNLPFYQGLAMARVATAIEGRVASARRRGHDDAATGLAAVVDACVRHGRRMLGAA